MKGVAMMSHTVIFVVVDCSSNVSSHGGAIVDDRWLVGYDRLGSGVQFCS